MCLIIDTVALLWKPYYTVRLSLKYRMVLWVRFPIIDTVNGWNGFDPLTRIDPQGYCRYLSNLALFNNQERDT